MFAAKMVVSGPDATGTRLRRMFGNLRDTRSSNRRARCLAPAVPGCRKKQRRPLAPYWWRV